MSRGIPVDGEEGGRARLRVFVLSADERFRRAVGDLLEHEGMEVVGESGSAREAVGLIGVLCPDVAVLDSRVPDGEGVQVCRQARDSMPGLGCVVLASYPHESPAPGAAGPRGCEFVLREIGAHDLPGAIRRAAGQCPGPGEGSRP